jgi:predicted transcriptional regulator
MTTIRIAEENQQKLDKIAKTLDRSRNWLVNDAIEQYLSIYDRQVAQIKAAIKEADAGKFVSDAEMEELINSYRD